MMARKRTNFLAEECGISLLELMVALGILAVAASVAIPSYKDWNARVRLKYAVAELSSNMNMTRMAAMNRNATSTVTISTVSGRVQATFRIGTTDIIPAQVMGGEITGAGGVSSIQFSSLGLRSGGGTSNQTITLTNNMNVTYAVEVTPAGKIRWCTQSSCS